jgi:hypothetical protein
LAVGEGSSLQRIKLSLRHEPSEADAWSGRPAPAPVAHVVGLAEL